MAERDFDNPVAEGEGEGEGESNVTVIPPPHVDEEAQRKEEERLKSAWCGLLHPDTGVRHAYDLGQLAIMFYLGYQLPLRLAFKKTATSPLEVALTIIIDGSVWVDMYMQMRMAYARSAPRGHHPASLAPSVERSVAYGCLLAGCAATTTPRRRSSSSIAIESSEITSNHGFF
jgi:hypothetical protein